MTKISPLIDQLHEIFSSSNPEKMINQYARNHKPKLNESRTRLWFFTYLAFGRNKWALLPSYCNCGHWDRLEKYPGKKFGRPSVARGKGAGFGKTKGMIVKILKGFHEYKSLGTTMNTIHRKTLVGIFGCNTVSLNKGIKAFSHPDGEPFPTYNQFYREVHKTIGTRNVQLALYGEVRVRTKLAASKGKFSEAVSNLVEKLDGDAYNLKEVPRGPRDGEPMPILSVVRLRCVTSGYLVGIGFAIGNERKEAYQMALFSMAISKVKFCAMFGLAIIGEEWNCIGLPPWVTVDRGPGGTGRLIEEFEVRIPIRQLSPSYMGQSKATVESSHPRDIKIDGKQTYILSDKNYVELAKREILRTISDNNCVDGSERMTPNMRAAGVIPTPAGIWKYLDERMRTDAHPIPFDAAVRNLLVKKEFTLHEDGVYLHGLRFDSGGLRNTGLHEKVIGNRAVKITGWILILSLRQAWINVDGKTIEVHALLPIRDDEQQLYISLPELAPCVRLLVV